MSDDLVGFGTETALGGGNSTDVCRVGDTVRRAMGTYSPAVHQLLSHLEARGFAHSPRFLGIDDRGREILTYRDGVVGNYPMPTAIRSLDALETAAKILREFHDLTVGLNLPECHVRHLPEDVAPEVICHWDAAPYNFVFDGSDAVALIDFDEAGPGRRIDDLAYFAYRFAPLCSPDNAEDGGWEVGTDRYGRLRRIFTVYPDSRAADLPDMIIARLEDMRSAISTTPSASTRSHLALYARDQLFVDRNRSKIVAAISSAAG